MKILVGSKNQNKVEAVDEIIKEYDIFSGHKVFGKNVPSGVSEQPKSLKKTIKGARNRARNAFIDCNYSFGIESGLMDVPYSKTGFMDVTACAIYDGAKFHLGLSSCFEFPVLATKLALEKGLNMNEAFYKLGLSKLKRLGYAEGGVGMLTKGRIVRKDYIKQAIIMALIHLENKELY